MIEEGSWVVEPGREIDGQESAADAQNVTNEPKLCDDMLNTETGVRVEVTADSGCHSGLDTVRTNPTLEEVSSQLSGGVSSRLLVVSCSDEAGAERVALPGLEVEQPTSAAQGRNLTNEAKFCDDVFNTENKGDLEVTANSGFDSGLDTGRTKPELEEDSSQLLVVSCLKTEAGGGDVGGVIRPPEVGDGGAAGERGGVGGRESAGPGGD